MGAQQPNQALAGSAADRLKAAQASRQGIEQRQAAIRNAEVQANAPQTGRAPMFPRETPGPSIPPGMEESVFRRGELASREDQMSRGIAAGFPPGRGITAGFPPGRGIAATVAPGGALERGVGVFGAPFGGAGQGPAQRSGIAFGPGRSTRTPDAGTPEYQQLVNRMRSRGIR